MGEKEIKPIGRRGLPKKHSALDCEIWQWKTNLEKTRGKQRVTKNEVQAYALEAYRIAGITNFKASDGWYRRWRVRWKNSDVIKDVEKEDKTEVTADAEMEDTLVPPKRRKIESYSVEEKVKNTTNFNERATTKICADKNNKKSCNEQSVVSTGHTKIQSSVSSEDQTRNTSENATIKTKFPVELNTMKSGSDSLILGVNYVKLKKTKSNKNVILVHPKESLETKLISSFVTTEIPDSINFNQLFDMKVCCKIQSNPEHINVTETNSVDSQKLNFLQSCEQDKILQNENENICQVGFEKKLKLIETREEMNSWAVVSQGQINVSSVPDNPVCSQSDSGISIPSSSGTSEVSDSFILSQVYEQNEMDFSEHEHELFCDSCEDFHPRQKCSHFGRKQKKEVKNSFLLSCVFEKKETIPVADFSVINIKSDRNLANNTCDSLDSQLNNPRVVAPKGKRYLVQFKSKVVNYALNHSVKLAAEKFKVNRNTIAEWLAERNRFSTCMSVQHVDQHVAEDTDFLAWLEDSKFNLTNELLKQKTQEWLLNSQTSSRQRGCHWLQMYAHRLNETEDVASKKRYIIYPEAFKRAVVFHAQTHSNVAAARVFGVARKRIIEWQQHSGDLKKTPKHVNANNVTDEAVDIQVYEWFCQQQPIPTSKQVRNKALELYRAAGHSSIQCGSQWYYRWRARHKLPRSRDQQATSMTPLLIWALAQLDNNKFVSQSALAAQAAILGQKKVSRGWTFRFCKKYSSLLQSLPAPETSLPSVLERQVIEFKEKLHNLIITRGVTDNRIIALDEIPLHFLPKDKAKKPLLVRRPGFESCQASLMVSCLADGTLLPTVFVFKGSGPETNSSSDPRVLTVVNDTGQISNDAMQKWFLDVCFPHMKSEGVGVVVLDSFDAHVTSEVSQSVMSHDVHVVVTPPGCAFRLLPVIPFCHSFKAMLEEMCQVWLSSQTAALESPSPDQLYLWAVKAHKHIAKHYKEKIQSAFKDMILPLPSQFSE